MKDLIHTKTNNNIIIWSSSFLPVIGGLESVTFEIAKYLTERNWNVSVITNRYPRSLKSNETISDIKVKRYTFLTGSIHYLRSGRIDLFLAWFFYKPVTLIRLIIDFIRFKPKVVNLHFPDHQLFECFLLSQLFRFKLIISLHGNEVERMRKLSKRSIRYYLYDKLFISAVGITGCSKFLINEFQRIFTGIKSHKCYPMYNGVGERFLKQELKNNKRAHVFCAARFVPKKGLDLLLEATSQITGNHLLIAGGDENEFLDLGLHKREGINILGLLSSEDMAKYLVESKITILPSKKEPYGILVAEALCCGSPVVATNIGGIPEVISLAREKLDQVEKGVFDCWVKLVKPDAESIRNAITDLMNNNSNIEDYINLIPKIHRQFSWSIRLSQYQSLLASL